MPLQEDRSSKSIWNREPAQLLGLIYGLVAGLATFVFTLQSQVGNDADWKELLLVGVATAIPLLQGRTTRANVYAPETYDRAVSFRGGSTG